MPLHVAVRDHVPSVQVNCSMSAKATSGACSQGTRTTWVESSLEQEFAAEPSHAAPSVRRSGGQRSAAMVPMADPRTAMATKRILEEGMVKMRAV